MRVNVYAEEMTDRIEIISKTIDGQEFTGLRIYLELPASYVPTDKGGLRPANAEDKQQAAHFKAPFIHHPGDDDSSAITIWGKRDLRELVKQIELVLTEHYSKPTQQKSSK